MTVKPSAKIGDKDKSLRLGLFNFYPACPVKSVLTFNQDSTILLLMFSRGFEGDKPAKLNS
jgi:hypothetical protein